VYAGIPRALELVCLKAMRKNPARRYSSVSELRADLERIRAGTRVKARPPGEWERLGRLARRHRAWWVPVALSACILLGALIVIRVRARMQVDDLLAAAHAARRAHRLSEAEHLLAQVELLAPDDLRVRGGRIRLHLASAERWMLEEQFSRAEGHWMTAVALGARRLVPKEVVRLERLISGTSRLTVQCNAVKGVWIDAAGNRTAWEPGAVLLRPGIYRLELHRVPGEPISVQIIVERNETRTVQIHLPEPRGSGYVLLGAGDRRTGAGARKWVSPFQVTATPVDHAAFKRFVDRTGHRTPKFWKRGTYADGRAAEPVNFVSREDAVTYARAHGGRLPSEAEWHFLNEAVPPTPGLLEWTSTAVDGGWILLGAAPEGHYRSAADAALRTEQLGFRVVIPARE
jgi:hypothetical protein